MIKSLFLELGGWSWMILGLVLLVLEIIVSGTFLLWFGIAALVIGVFTLALAGVAFWSLQAQWISFVILSILFVFIGKRILTKSKSTESEELLLNQRSQQMVGREAILIEAISQGIGRIEMGDTIWRVTGEDTPVGTKVKITGQSGSTVLVVESV